MLVAGALGSTACHLVLGFDDKVATSGAGRGEGALASVCGHHGGGTAVRGVSRRDAIEENLWFARDETARLHLTLIP